MSLLHLRRRKQATKDGTSDTTKRWVGRIHQQTTYFSLHSLLSPSNSSLLVSVWVLSLFLYTSYFLFCMPSLTPTPSPNLSSPITHLTLPTNNIEIISKYDLSIEIFSAPYPYRSSDIHTQQTIKAIKSWLKLKPKPKVTLLGKNTSEYKQHFQSPTDVVTANSNIDTTFLGVPLFNSILHVANSSTANITILINSDILLFPDFIHTLNKVYLSFQDFLIIAARYDVDQIDDMDKNGTLHTFGGMDLWAWNTNGSKLYDPIMPTFVFGRGKYDNWFTHEAISANRRTVIDVTETCVLVHQRHNHVSLSASSNSTLNDFFWSQGKRSKFELFINIYLSINGGGTYTNQKGSILYAPWKTSKCMHNEGICLIPRIRPGICACEHSVYAHQTQTDPVLLNDGNNTLRCGVLTNDTKQDFEIPVLSRARKKGKKKAVKKFGLPLTRKDLIEKVKDDQDTIILTGVNFGYKDFLMNWVCNMRRLGIENFIVAAFDTKVYRYGFIKGLPIYYENTVSTYNFSNSNDYDDDNEVEYGSDTFKELTKMKSRTVLNFLKLGIHVLWSDVDVVFFKNPLHSLRSKYSGDILIQSNSLDSEPLIAHRRLNSGFYLVHSNEHTIEAFRTIILYARRSNMSEQPCFYDVLCGKNDNSITANIGCVWQKSVNLRVLDRSIYANGKTLQMWDTGIIPKNVIILHNNWAQMKGPYGKRARLQRLGLNYYDSQQQLCLYES